MARMEKARSAHAWIARYCIRTLQLLPSLPAPVAIRWAVHGYPYCADEEPERAAESFVDTREAWQREHGRSVLQRFLADDESPPPSAGPSADAAGTHASGARR